MYNLIVSTLSSSSVYIFSLRLSLSVLLSKIVPLYTYIYTKHHMSIFNFFKYISEKLYLYYLVLIKNVFTRWPHDSSHIMALMLSPRHNGIHDCIYLLMQFIT